MATAIYARMSLDRQGEGAGVDRQLKDCRALVRKQGWEDVIEFTDPEISAFSGKVRPGYAAMLAKVKAGEVSRIVVWHADRLYRRPKELEELIDLADAGRVQVVSVYSGELDLSNSDGRMVARMLIAVASKSSEDTSRRVRRAKQQAREKGLGSGGPRPFGWKSTWVLDEKGKRRRVLTEDPAEADLIRAAIADLLKGASLRDIARRWNAAKVLQPQERARHGWTAAIVRLVVSNPRLAGLIGHRVEKPAGEGVGSRYLPAMVIGKAQLPGLIDRPTWEQLQGLLDRRGAEDHAPRRRSLLTGLVTCAKCGQTMKRSGTRAGNGTYTRKAWRCYPPVNHDGGWAGHASIDATGLEDLLVEATLRVADTTTFAAMIRQQGRKGRQARDMVAELEELERQIDEAATSYAAGRLPIRAFEHATAAIQRQQKTLQARLGPLTETAPLEPYAGRRGALRAAWPTLTIDQQREIIAAALGRVTVSPTRTPGRPTFDPRRVKIRGKS